MAANNTAESYALFHILAIKTNYYQLENFKRIRQKIERNSINPIMSFDFEEMKQAIYVSHKAFIFMVCILILFLLRPFSTRWNFPLGATCSFA